MLINPHVAVCQSEEPPSQVAFWHFKRDLCQLPTGHPLTWRISDSAVGWACPGCRGRKRISEDKGVLEFCSAPPRGMNITGREEAKEETGWRRELS